MKFICPEIEGQDLNTLIGEFYETRLIKEISISDTDGNNLTRLIEANSFDGGVNSKRFYFGRSLLTAYFSSYPLNVTAMTIAELATALGITIDKNFTDTADYTFLFRSLLDPLRPFNTSLWFTVFTDAGLYLALPIRRSDAKQLTIFDVISDMKKDDYFDAVDYHGETGANITVNADYGNVIPATMNAANKGRVLNKSISKNRIVRVRSGRAEYRPADFFAYDGTVFVILSKTTLDNGAFEYVGVQEYNDNTWTFSADETPVAVLPGVVDYWHYVGAAGEPAFGTGWEHLGGTSPRMRYKKMPDGTVRVQGSVKNGTTNVIFTLPVGYRPAYAAESAPIRNSSTTVERCQILTDGRVYMISTSGNKEVLINTSFTTD